MLVAVIGGVSNGEIAKIDAARGSSAKHTLVWYWVSEILTREHLAGSTGEVGAPILSRIYQFMSDGNIGYNQARKVNYIPFPFAHAQISAMCSVFLLFLVPRLCLQYVNSYWEGVTLTLTINMCIFGLYEVSRDLENPFRNAPNDLPLCTLQAMFNESLLGMMNAGYHPDLYWNSSEFLDQNNVVRVQQQYVVGDDRRASKVMEEEEDDEDDPQKADLSFAEQQQVGKVKSRYSMEEIIVEQAVRIEELKTLLYKDNDD